MEVVILQAVTPPDMRTFLPGEVTDEIPEPQLTRYMGSKICMPNAPGINWRDHVPRLSEEFVKQYLDQDEE